MDSKFVKLIFFAPLSHGDIVRKSMGDAGAGVMGNYTHCTFSSVGKGKFLPGKGANPSIGEVGKFEEVEEERIETLCPKEIVKKVVKAIKKVHPYEEVAFDIIPLVEMDELS